MLKKKYDVAIVNRSFWPDFPVLGEALLSLAESLSKDRKVTVLSQGKAPIKETVDKLARAQNVNFETYLTPPKSSYSLIRRVIQSVMFTFWVFLKLCVNRPRLVYVATDPPITVPFFVFIYAKLFGAKYIYHVQDIHPEITAIYLKKKGRLFKFLRYIDNISLNNASHILTLSEDMVSTIRKSLKKDVKISLIDNPGINIEPNVRVRDEKTVIYCGNAGRLQRFPLLLNSISSFLDSGGNLKFVFIGGGVYSKQLKKLSDKYENFSYQGFLPPPEASKYIESSSWALLPIDDAVTRYAFPSKSSTYAAFGIPIIGICGKETSVGQWLLNGPFGIVIEPEEDVFIKLLEDIDCGKCRFEVKEEVTRSSKERLSRFNFVQNLKCTVDLYL